MVQAKLAITTKCGARCVTCPSWKMPVVTMPFGDFRIVWDKLNNSRLVNDIVVNGTGDFFCLADYRDYARHIEDNKRKYVTIITNGQNLDYIPRVDNFIISFNGCDKETYENTTGLPFETTVQRIKNAYNQLDKNVKRPEIHCLVYEGNPDPEDRIYDLFEDFPGRIRLSFKYDNQFEDDKTLAPFKRVERIPCDYLEKLIIYPTGTIIKCNHDFGGECEWGSLIWESVEECYYGDIERIKVGFEHKHGQFKGLCEKCNYNTKTEDKFVYIK